MGIQISVQNLAKRFNREWIFRDLTYTFSSGNTYALTGPNGCGKSTLLQVLWGQMPPSKGLIEYRDSNVKISIEEVYQRLSIATPYMDLIDEFTLTEQLQFHFKLKKSRQGITIEEMIERMYLPGARDKHLSNFSSGMKQRVKLALAFFTEAEVIFLDEPGTNLDNQAFSWYLTELNALPASTILVIASNQPSEYSESSKKVNILDYK